jgi:hypothetical protein
MALLSNELANLNQSFLGDSFLDSIANYNISRAKAGTENKVSEEKATILGIQNSLTAMLDSILLYYGAAQIMIPLNPDPSQLSPSR